VGILGEDNRGRILQLAVQLDHCLVTVLCIILIE
jgi:hypothetical protein